MASGRSLCKIRVFSLFFSTLALSSLLTACGTFSRIQTDVEDAAVMRYGETGDLRTEVDKLARPIIERNRTPGLVVGVLPPDGEKQFFGYGVTGHGRRCRPERHTQFDIGSTGKGFVSAIAAILVREGKLTWDCRLGELLPEHIQLSDDAAEITVMQLATHSSGLARQPFSFRTGVYFIQYLFTGRNFYRHFDYDYIMNYLADFNAPKDPVERYSNIGFGLLGHIIELRTGMDLGELMRERLLTPLELDATGFDPEQLPGFSRRALGHSGDQPKFMRRGRPVPEWHFTDIMRGSAGLYSTADDLMSYASAHLYTVNDEFLDSILRDTLTVRIECTERARALAWAVDYVEEHEITFQIGFSGGFSSYIGMDRENRTAVVVLQNSLNWTESIGHRLLLLMARAEAL